jgi:hypothetical protein
MPPLHSLELERKTRWMVGPKDTNEQKCVIDKLEEPLNLTNRHRSLNSHSREIVIVPLDLGYRE